MVAAYKGQRKLTDTRTTGMQLCAIIACSNKNDMNSCGTLYPANTMTLNRFNFLRIDIKAKFPSKDILVMPNTVNTFLMPLHASEFSLTNVPTRDNDEDNDG